MATAKKGARRIRPEKSDKFADPDLFSTAMTTANAPKLVKR
jgi:hypothetical protein